MSDTGYRSMQDYWADVENEELREVVPVSVDDAAFAVPAGSARRRLVAMHLMTFTAVAFLGVLLFFAAR